MPTVIEATEGSPRKLVFSPQVVEEARRTFRPYLGNPENGDYNDWSDHLRATERRLNQESAEAPP